MLDLDALTLVEPDALRAMVVHLLEAGPVGRLRLAARHGSAIAVLTRWRIHELVPIHTSVDDAVNTHFSAASAPS